MRWFIGHQSALEFWRKAFAQRAFAGKRLRACSLPDRPADARELRAGNPWGLAVPLHVLVGSGNARKETRGLKCHVDSRRFPAGSFILLPSGLIVSSPELCFVQLAGELSLVELILIGFEFCGRYRLDAESEPERGFRDDLPLTSVSKLNSYIAKVKGMRGCKNAGRALRFIADEAASPMESILTMMLVLPYKLGGYGFPKPLLNAPVEVSNGMGVSTGKARYFCDLYWPAGQVDVEYDSDAYHTGPSRISKDAARRNALSSVGVTVVTVSRKQVASTIEFRKTAEALGKLLGKRLYNKTPEFFERHIELRARLLPSSIQNPGMQADRDWAGSRPC